MMNLSKQFKMLLFTDEFPFEGREVGFISSEYKEFVKNFSVTIVTCVDKKKIEKKEKCFGEILPETENIVFDARLLFVDKIKGMRCVFDPIWWKELCCVIKDKELIVSRILHATYFYCLANKYRELIIKNGLLNSLSHDKVLGYTFWNTYYTMSLCMLKKKYPNLVIVSRAHGYDLYNDRVEGINRQPFKGYMDGKIDRINFICHEGKEYYINHFSKTSDSGKYSVEYLGVKGSGKINQSQFLDGKIFNIVSCSRMIPLKRVDMIVDSLAILPDAYHIKWTHFGGGSETDRITRLCEELLAGKENIEYTLTGNIHNDIIMDYYANTPVDAFLSTSSKEGLPVSIMEAFSYGIPAIGTDVNGTHEAVMDGYNGYLLASTPSTEDVVNAIIHIYDSDDLERQNMRENALATWSKLFDSDKNSLEYTSKLLELLNGEVNYE